MRVNLLQPFTFNLLATTTTNVFGYYEFTGLMPGSYVVEFELPAGYNFSPPDLGFDDGLDSDADINSGRTEIINLGEGDDISEFDAGLGVAGLNFITLGDLVWLDANGNHMPDQGEGLPGVNVVLFDDLGNVLATSITDGNGNYLFSGIAQGDYRIEVDVSTLPANVIQIAGPDDVFDSAMDLADQTVDNPDVDFGYQIASSIGDYVWNDINKNGIQDTSEPGMSGIKVYLIDADSGAQVAVTITDSSGFYRFDDLAAGNYKVKFDFEQGYVFTSQNGSYDDNDSDVFPATGETGVIKLGVDDNNMTVDAGMYNSDYKPPGVLWFWIGDFVWVDYNNNDEPDTGEGISGIRVVLYDEAGVIVAETITDSDGGYIFDNLVPGDYKVIIDGSTVPAGLRLFRDPDSVLDGQHDVEIKDSNYPDADFGYKLDSEKKPDLDNTMKSAKDINDGDLKPGDVIWYAVTVYNAGEASAFNVVLTDSPGQYTTLMPGTVSAQKGRVVTGNNNGDTEVRVEIGIINPKESIVITYQVMVDEDAPKGAMISNQGMVTALNYPDTPTDFPETPSKDDPTIIGPVDGEIINAQIDIAKRASDLDGDPLKAGDTIEYIIDIMNHGPDTATNLIFTDSVPVYTKFVTGTLKTTKGSVGEDAPLSVSIKELAPGETVSVSFRVVLTDDVPENSIISNQGILNGDGGVRKFTDDPGTSEKDDPTNLVVEGGAPEIKTYKSFSDLNGGSVNPGDILEYTIVIENTGTSAAGNVVFSDNPGGFISLIPGTVGNEKGEVVSGNGSSDTRVEVNIGTLGPGEISVITFQVLIDKNVPNKTRIPNQGSVSALNSPPVPTDDPSTPAENDPTVVVVVYEPEIYDPPHAIKTVFGGYPVIQWQVTWINDSNVVAILVHVEDVIPANVTYVPGSVEADYGLAYYDEARNMIAWDGTIPGNGGRVTIKYKTNVPEDVHHVENQAGAIWDQDGNGDWRNEKAEGLTPVMSDDPATDIENDSTKWSDGLCEVELGNFIWLDKNKNGFFDSNETGLDGVKLTLFADSDDNGIFTPDVDKIVTTTITRSKDGKPGFYRFDKLCPGGYIVLVDESNFMEGGALKGLVSSPGDPDPDNDVDNDDNGYKLQGTGVISYAIRLDAGSEPVTDGDDNANTNLTLDFGFYRPDSDNNGGECNLSLGNRVWIDTCINQPCGTPVFSLKPGMPKPVWHGVDPDRSGINGIKVNLYKDTDGSGDYTPDIDQFVASTITGVCNDCTTSMCGTSGYYRFDNLCPGDYIVQIDSENFENNGVLCCHTSLDGAPDPDNDVNNDDNGYEIAGQGVVSKTISLQNNGEPVNDGDNDSNTNLTVDFGFYRNNNSCP